MSQRLYSDEAIILFKQEATEQVDPTPTGAANAFRVRNMSFKPLETKEEELNYIRGYSGASPSVVVESFGQCEFEIDFTSSGTPGTAPPWAASLRCCGMDETTIAAAVTGTAQAGSTTSLTLAAGASAIDNYYCGLEVTATGGVGNGQSGIIIDYNGTTKVATLHKAVSVAFDNTTEYSIEAAVFYEPILGSTAPTGCIYYNNGGINHILLGSRGEVTFDNTAGSMSKLKFMFTGVRGTVSDAAVPTGVYTAWQDPIALLTENVKVRIAGLQADGTANGLQLKSFTLAKGNEVSYRQLIGASGVILPKHKATGQVSIEQPLLAVHNFYDDILNVTKYPFLFRNGTVAGKRTGIFMPQMTPSKLQTADDTGIWMANIDYKAVPLVGHDDFRVICS